MTEKQKNKKLMDEWLKWFYSHTYAPFSREKELYDEY